MDSTSILYSKNTPVTFLSWLESQNTVSAEFKDNFDRYQRYVQEWTEINKDKKTIDKDFFYSFYIDLLKEITLNFVTEEERRFLVNFDYTIEENLDIVLPFFIEKLKNICLFYSDKREKLKENLSLSPYKGTNLFIKKIVKNLIVENYESGYVIKKNEGKVSFPSLSAITKSLDVYIDEIYDDENYYNKDPNSKDSSILNYGKVDVDLDLYTNFKESIKRAIENYPLYVSNIFGNFSINYTLSGDELYYLKERDFINYTNSLSSQDLSLNLKKQLFPKYSSTDFYYLSVGSSINNFVSGTLFNSSEYTNKTSNLTNRQNSTVAAVPSFNDLYTSYYMGKFFTPAKTGVLQYNSFKKTIEIDKTKISPNTVYVLPDPEIFEIEKSPVLYRVDVSWVKEDLGGGFKFGDVLIDKHFQRFYAYQSYSQDINHQPYGLSLSVDNIDFWGGDRDTIWTESDLWPGTNEVEKLPIDSRVQSLLFDEGTCVSWFTDYFGNEFGLYKDIGDVDGIFEKRRLKSGSLYIKNTVTNLVSSADYFLANIFRKYPDTVKKELEEGVYSVYVNRSFILIETKNFVCVDSYNFDFSTGEFLIDLLPGLYIKKYEINEYLEKYIGHYYVEKTEDVYICFLKLVPNLSASNYKSLYPSIYRINLNNRELNQIYPKRQFDATLYSLSAEFKDFPEVDLKYVDGGKFSFKEKFNLFNLTYFAYNENNVPYFVSEQFSIENNSNKFVSYAPLLHKPYYYVHDTNFANPGVDTTLRFGSIYSDNVGHKRVEQFKWAMEKENFDNYYFCSKINPVFINMPGTHFVQFDWTQYLNGNLFLGCQNFQANFIDNRNFINFAGKITELTKEETWYSVGDVTIDGYSFTLSAYKPYKSTGNIIGFSITNSEAPPGLIFCDNLFSVYRTIYLNLVGKGKGIVISDPYCIECEKKTDDPVTCTFQYPLSGTINFKASAYNLSIFKGWKGGSCDGTVGNCIYTTTETNTFSAEFSLVPRSTIKVMANIPERETVIFDGISPSGIRCFNTTCSAVYDQGTVVAVSAGPAPLGYKFDRFVAVSPGNSIPQTFGNNNPATFALNNENYSLTAFYLSAANDITLLNYFNVGSPDERKFGYLFASPKSLAFNEQPIEIKLTQPDTVLAWVSGKRDTGTLECSLSPGVNISGFGIFRALKDSTITITASTDNPIYIFERYAGNPCNNAKNVCGFTLTNNVKISAFFNYPIYTVSIYNANPTYPYYTESNDGKLNAGTRDLVETRNKTSTTYVSGTIITLSSVSLFPAASGIRKIDAVTKSVETSNLIKGSPYLILSSYLITQSVVISAFCDQATISPPFTVIKRGVPPITNSTLITPWVFIGDPIASTITRTLKNSISAVYEGVFTAYGEIEYYPVLNTYTNTGMKHIYTKGKGVYIKLNPALPLIITTNSGILNNDEDIIDNSGGLLRLGGDSDLKTPLYLEPSETLLKMKNELGELRYFSTLIDPVTAEIFFKNI